MQGGTGVPEARSQERRVYRHRLHRWFVLFGVICAIGVASNVAFGLANANVPNVVSGLAQLPVIIYLFLLARVLRIETSPDGLAYHNTGVYTVRAGWEDVERVAHVPFRSMGEVECILLRRSTVRGWTGLALAWAVPKTERGLTIPLSKGRSAWSDADDLRRDVLRHAPHAVG